MKNKTNELNKSIFNKISAFFSITIKYVSPASVMHSEALMNCVDTNNLLTLKQLLENGVSPKITEVSGNHSALLVAADNGYYEVCRQLLIYGANPNYCNDSGESVLGCAITSQNEEVVKLVLSYGADPYGSDLIGLPILAYALDAPKGIRIALLNHIKIKNDMNAQG